MSIEGATQQVEEQVEERVEEQAQERGLRLHPWERHTSCKTAFLADCQCDIGYIDQAEVHFVAPEAWVSEQTQAAAPQGAKPKMHSVLGVPVRKAARAEALQRRVTFVRSRDRTTRWAGSGGRSCCNSSRGDSTTLHGYRSRRVG